MVSRSKTVNPPHGDLVLSGVSISSSPNLDILRVKFDRRFTFEDLVRGIVSRASQRIGILRFGIVDTSVVLCCYYAFVLQLLSIVLLCVGLLMNVIFCFSSARCIRWSGFALIRVSCRCVIDVMLPHYVCCTRLFLSRITVCRGSFHQLLSELDILELRLQLIH